MGTQQAKLVLVTYPDLQMYHVAILHSRLLSANPIHDAIPGGLSCSCREAHDTGMMPKRKSDGSWVYPDSEKVLKAAGLRTIAHYVGVRRATVLRYVSKRPIYELCIETNGSVALAGKLTGLSRRWFWRRTGRALLRQRRMVRWIFSSSRPGIVASEAEASAGGAGQTGDVTYSGSRGSVECP